jgi:hypothetical protein
VFDLLGSVAATEPTGATTIGTLRTDAYGRTIGLYPVTKGSLTAKLLRGAAGDGYVVLLTADRSTRRAEHRSGRHHDRARSRQQDRQLL